jgi:uncharacterized protein YjbI with pentapeptide repeats
MRLGSKWRSFCYLLILQFAALGRTQIQPGVYWQRVRQIPPTPAKLEAAVKAHELWVESDGAAGARADFSHANLSNFNLSGANLWGADLAGTYLAGAELTGALLGSDGQKNQQTSKVPGEFLPSPPRITSVNVMDANGRVVSETQAAPGPTNLAGAILMSSTLVRADLSYADLSKAVLSGADLSGADLRGSNLAGAYLLGTRLDEANLTDADLDGATFEPRSVTSVVGLESVSGLSRVTFDRNPDSLVRIRKQFQDEGLRQQEREVTYDINRRQTQLDPTVERWFRFIAFDLTCQYGMSPGRPLRIVAVLWAIFSATYIALAHWHRCFRVRISRFHRGTDKLREFWMWPPPVHAEVGERKLRGWLRFEGRVAGGMAFFSVVNAFNIGYREFNFGQWLRMLTKRQYELRATGWVRSLAGVQSLLTVYLFALWILAYFGRPFE